MTLVRPANKGFSLICGWLIVELCKVLVTLASGSRFFRLGLTFWVMLTVTITKNIDQQMLRASLSETTE